jgi:hypothetical protein
MKIICLEEHVFDNAIAQASRDVVMQEAAYMADWGSRVEDKPGTEAVPRPRLLAAKHALPLACETGKARIADMDRHGIDMQVLSHSNSPQQIPDDSARDRVRAANDALAEVVRNTPSRFAGFASLPWQMPEVAASELERAVTELGLKGTLLNGRPGASFLDDERYTPILARLNELRVPIYLHPGSPLPAVQQPYYGGLGREVSARLSLFGWGWHNEAGVQLLRMILSGVFDRYPNLQVISGHWGEMVPFFLQRLDDMIPLEASGLSRSITQTYRDHVSVTPSGMLHLPHFEFIRTILGADRILYSIDYPYLTMDGARRFLEALPISQAEKDMIAHGNAERLLGL